MMQTRLVKKSFTFKQKFLLLTNALLNYTSLGANSICQFFFESNKIPLSRIQYTITQVLVQTGPVKKFVHSNKIPLSRIYYKITQVWVQTRLVKKFVHSNKILLCNKYALKLHKSG